jgi:hypothetical protein
LFNLQQIIPFVPKMCPNRRRLAIVRHG